MRNLRNAISFAVATLSAGSAFLGCDPDQLDVVPPDRVFIKPEPVVLTEPRVDGLAGEGQYGDDATAVEFLAAYPTVTTLNPSAQDMVVHLMNRLPAPCVPCKDHSMARCAVVVPQGCENHPKLVDRAVRFARLGHTSDELHLALAYSDVWIPFETERPMEPPNAAVRVDLWMDATSPFLDATLATVAQLPPTAGVAWHLLPATDRPGSRVMAIAILAAQRQGMLLEYAQASQRWREDARADVRSGNAIFGTTAAIAIAHGLAPQGLDVARFESDMADPKLATILAEDISLASSIGARAAPSWFVNGYRLRGSQSHGAINRLVSMELEESLGRTN